MFAKNARIEMPKLLKAANGQSCIRCGREDSTVVAAHYSGTESGKIGKGMGTKVHDCCVADLCRECHAAFDGYDHPNDYERGFEFLMCVAMTVARRIRDGVIK